MSSSEEQGLSASLSARANEAAKDPHLLWLGQKAPSPRQAAIICQILGLTNEEEKNVKAVAVLKRTWPFVLQDLLQGKFFKASEAKNKKTEEEKGMRAVLRGLKGKAVKIYTLNKMWGMDNIRGIVIKAGKECVQVSNVEGDIFVRYDQIAEVIVSG